MMPRFSKPRLFTLIATCCLFNLVVGQSKDWFDNDPFTEDVEKTDDNSCWVQCGSIDVNEQFQAGVMHRYSWNGEIKTKLAGVSEKETGLRISAEVELVPFKSCLADLIFKSVQIKSIEEDGERLVENIDLSSFRTNPLLLQFQNGHIVRSACISKSDPIWVTNVRRAVASHFQLSLSAASTRTLEMEVDVHGRCPTSFQLLRSDVGDRVNGSYEVRKTKDLSTCSDRHSMRSLLRGVRYSAADSIVHSLPLLNSTQTCEFTVSNDLISRVSCLETHQFRPFSRGRQETGALSSVKSQLVLLGSEKSQYGSSPITLNRRRTSLLFETSESRSSRSPQRSPTDVQLARAALSELCASPRIGSVFQEKFDLLLGSIRRLSTADLQSLLDAAANPSICQAIEDESQKTAATSRVLSTLKDALTLAKTDESIEVIVESLSRKNSTRVFSETDRALWYTSLVFLDQPTVGMVRSLGRLLAPEAQPTRQTYLVVSTVVHAFCASSSNQLLLTRSCSQIPEVNDILWSLFGRLGNDCSLPSQHNVQSVLLAIGNIGELPAELSANSIDSDSDNVDADSLALDSEIESGGLVTDGASSRSVAVKQSLGRCVLNGNASITTRVAAIQAFRRVKCDADRASLFSVFKDLKVDAELRINAYLGLMRCPTANDLRQVHEQLLKEQSMQVGSFVWTHLTNLAETSDVHKLGVRQILENIRLKREFDLPASQYSRNIEKSFFSDTGNFGGKADVNVLFSPASFVPRSMSVNLTADLFGHSVNFAELGVRLENFESVLQNYIGPGGLLRSPESRRNNLIEQHGATVNPPTAAIQTRVFGSEVYNADLFETYGKVAQLLGNSIRQARQLFSGREQSIDLIKTMRLLDVSDTQATGMGVPLVLSLNATLSAALSYSGSWTSRTERENSRLLFTLAPSGALRIVASMTSQIDAGRVLAGVQLRTDLRSSTGVQLAFARRGDSNETLILANASLLQKKLEIFAVESKVLQLSASSHTEITPSQANNAEETTRNVCSGRLLDRLFGLRSCFEVQYWNSSNSVNSPTFPLNGPARMSFSLSKTDVNNMFEFNYRYNNQLPNLLVLLDTPGSRVNRRLMLQIGFNASDSFYFALETPVKSVRLTGMVALTDQLTAFLGNVIVDGRTVAVLDVTQEESSSPTALSEEYGRTGDRITKSTRLALNLPTGSGVIVEITKIRSLLGRQYSFNLTNLANQKSITASIVADETKNNNNYRIATSSPWAELEWIMLFIEIPNADIEHTSSFSSTINYDFPNKNVRGNFSLIAQDREVYSTYENKESRRHLKIQVGMSAIPDFCLNTEVGYASAPDYTVINSSLIFSPNAVIDGGYMTFNVSRTEKQRIGEMNLKVSFAYPGREQEATLDWKHFISPARQSVSAVLTSSTLGEMQLSAKNQFYKHPSLNLSTSIMFYWFAQNISIELSNSLINKPENRGIGGSNTVSDFYLHEISALINENLKLKFQSTLESSFNGQLDFTGQLSWQNLTAAMLQISAQPKLTDASLEVSLSLYDLFFSGRSQPPPTSYTLRHWHKIVTECEDSMRTCLNIAYGTRTKLSNSVQAAQEASFNFGIIPGRESRGTYDVRNNFAVNFQKTVTWSMNSQKATSGSTTVRVNLQSAPITHLRDDLPNISEAERNQRLALAIQNAVYTKITYKSAENQESQAAEEETSYAVHAGQNIELMYNGMVRDIDIPRPQLLFSLDQVVTVDFGGAPITYVMNNTVQYRNPGNYGFRSKAVQVSEQLLLWETGIWKNSTVDTVVCEVRVRDSLSTHVAPRKTELAAFFNSASAEAQTSSKNSSKNSFFRYAVEYECVEEINSFTREINSMLMLNHGVSEPLNIQLEDQGVVSTGPEYIRSMLIFLWRLQAHSGNQQLFSSELAYNFNKEAKQEIFNTVVVIPIVRLGKIRVSNVQMVGNYSYQLQSEDLVYGHGPSGGLMPSAASVFAMSSWNDNDGALKTVQYVGFDKSVVSYRQRRVFGLLPRVMLLNGEHTLRMQLSEESTHRVDYNLGHNVEYIDAVADENGNVGSSVQKGKWHATVVYARNTGLVFRTVNLVQHDSATDSDGSLKALNLDASSTVNSNSAKALLNLSPGYLDLLANVKLSQQNNYLTVRLSREDNEEIDLAANVKFVAETREIQRMLQTRTLDWQTNSSLTMLYFSKLVESLLEDAAYSNATYAMQVIDNARGLLRTFSRVRSNLQWQSSDSRKPKYIYALNYERRITEADAFRANGHVTLPVIEEGVNRVDFATQVTFLKPSAAMFTLLERWPALVWVLYPQFSSSVAIQHGRRGVEGQDDNDNEEDDDLDMENYALYSPVAFSSGTLVYAPFALSQRNGPPPIIRIDIQHQNDSFTLLIDRQRQAANRTGAFTFDVGVTVNGLTRRLTSMLDYQRWQQVNVSVLAIDRANYAFRNALLSYFHALDDEERTFSTGLACRVDDNEYAVNFTVTPTEFGSSSVVDVNFSGSKEIVLQELKRFYWFRQLGLVDICPKLQLSLTSGDSLDANANIGRLRVAAKCDVEKFMQVRVTSESSEVSSVTAAFESNVDEMRNLTLVVSTESARSVYSLRSLIDADTMLSGYIKTWSSPTTGLAFNGLANLSSLGIRDEVYKVEYSMAHVGTLKFSERFVVTKSRTGAGTEDEDEGDRLLSVYVSGSSLCESASDSLFTAFVQAGFRSEGIRVAKIDSSCAIESELKFTIRQETKLFDELLSEDDTACLDQRFSEANANQVATLSGCRVSQATRFESGFYLDFDWMNEINRVLLARLRATDTNTVYAVVLNTSFTQRLLNHDVQLQLENIFGQEESDQLLLMQSSGRFADDGENSLVQKVCYGGKPEAGEQMASCQFSMTYQGAITRQHSLVMSVENSMCGDLGKCSARWSFRSSERQEDVLANLHLSFTDAPAKAWVFSLNKSNDAFSFTSKTPAPDSVDKSTWIVPRSIDLRYPIVNKPLAPNMFELTVDYPSVGETRFQSNFHSLVWPFSAASWAESEAETEKSDKFVSNLNLPNGLLAKLPEELRLRRLRLTLERIASDRFGQNVLLDEARSVIIRQNRHVMKFESDTKELKLEHTARFSPNAVSNVAAVLEALFGGDSDGLTTAAKALFSEPFVVDSQSVFTSTFDKLHLFTLDWSCITNVSCLLQHSRSWPMKFKSVSLRLGHMHNRKPQSLLTMGDKKVLFPIDLKHYVQCSVDGEAAVDYVGEYDRLRSGLMFRVDLQHPRELQFAVGFNTTTLHLPGTGEENDAAIDTAHSLEVSLLRTRSTFRFLSRNYTQTDDLRYGLLIDHVSMYRHLQFAHNFERSRGVLMHKGYNRNPALKHSLLLDLNAKEDLTKRFNYTYESVQFRSTGAVVRKLNALHPTRAVYAEFVSRPNNSSCAFEARWVKLSTRLATRSQQIQNLSKVDMPEATRLRIEASSKRNRTTETHSRTQERMPKSTWQGDLKIEHPALTDGFTGRLQTVTSEGNTASLSRFGLDLSYAADWNKRIAMWGSLARTSYKNVVEIEGGVVHRPSSLDVLLRYVHSLYAQAAEQSLLLSYMSADNQTRSFAYNTSLRRDPSDKWYKLLMNITTPSNNKLSVDGALGFPASKVFSSWLKLTMDDFRTLARLSANGHRQELVSSVTFAPTDRRPVALYELTAKYPHARAFIITYNVFDTIGNTRKLSNSSEAAMLEILLLKDNYMKNTLRWNTKYTDEALARWRRLRESALTGVETNFWQFVSFTNKEWSEKLRRLSTDFGRHRDYMKLGKDVTEWSKDGEEMLVILDAMVTNDEFFLKNITELLNTTYNTISDQAVDIGLSRAFDFNFNFNVKDNLLSVLNRVTDVAIEVFKYEGQAMTRWLIEELGNSTNNAATALTRSFNRASDRVLRAFDGIRDWMPASLRENIDWLRQQYEVMLAHVGRSVDAGSDLAGALLDWLVSSLSLPSFNELLTQIASGSLYELADSIVSAYRSHYFDEDDNGSWARDAKTVSQLAASTYSYMRDTVVSEGQWNPLAMFTNTVEWNESSTVSRLVDYSPQNGSIVHELRWPGLIRVRSLKDFYFAAQWAIQYAKVSVTSPPGVTMYRMRQRLIRLVNSYYPSRLLELWRRRIVSVDQLLEELVRLLPPYNTHAIMHRNHYITFDNSHFGFKGTCQHVLSRVRKSGSNYTNYELIVSHDRQPVATDHGRESIAIRLSNSSRSFVLFRNLSLFVDGQEARLGWPFRVNVEGVNVSGHRYREAVEMAVNNGELKIRCNNGLHFCYVSLRGWLFGEAQVTGLLGNYNNEKFDDRYLLRDGKLRQVATSEFSNTWSLCAGNVTNQLLPIEPEPDIIEENYPYSSPSLSFGGDNLCDEMLSKYSLRSPLSACFGELSPEPYKMQCYAAGNTSGWDSSEALCRAVQSYYRNCRLRGVPDISLPRACGWCSLKSYLQANSTATLRIGDTIKINNSVAESSNTSNAMLDITVIVDQSPGCNATDYSALMSTLGQIESALVENKQFADVRFAFVQFSYNREYGISESQAEEAMLSNVRVHVASGEILLKLNQLASSSIFSAPERKSNVVAKMNAKSMGKVIDVARRQVPFRLLASQSVIIIKCSQCTSDESGAVASAALEFNGFSVQFWSAASSATFGFQREPKRREENDEAGRSSRNWIQYEIAGGEVRGRKTRIIPDSADVDACTVYADDTDGAFINAETLYYYSSMSPLRAGKFFSSFTKTLWGNSSRCQICECVDDELPASTSIICKQC